MNEEIYEGTPAKEDILIGTDSGYNRYRRPDGSTYVNEKDGRLDYATAPPSHSNSWFNTVASEGVVEPYHIYNYLDLLLRYPQLVYTKENVLMFEQYFRRLPEASKLAETIMNKRGFKNIPEDVQQIIINIATRGYKQGGKLIKKQYANT